ncbi:MAG: DnaJ C-terminal domain-containing protein [Planctomycetota bacterium]
MADRDYYDVLGVSRTATQDEIRTAYRRLARKLHPDATKDEGSTERFAEVQQAYEVLGNAEKRAAYDRHGRAAFSGAAGGPGPRYSWTNAGGTNAGGDFDLDDLGSMFDAFFGGDPKQGSPRSRNRRAERASRPRPAEAELDISFQKMARGGTETVRVGSRGRAIEVTIPKGIADGAKLRVGGRRGEQDLLLTVRVGKHPLYRREGYLDLVIALPLDYAEAALGCEIEVPTLEGSVMLTVPPGTRSGRRLRLRERGLSDAKGGRGDLFAEVQIVPPPPEAIDEATRQLLVTLSGLGPSPRTAPEWGARSE